MKNSIQFITKTMLTALIVLSASALSFSQTNQFGIMLNSLTTNFNYGKNNSELKSHKKDYTGLQAGVSYQAGISSRFSVVTELAYTSKGGILTKNNALTATKTTVRLSAVEMPVLARVHFGNLYLNAGPYAACNLGGRIKTAGVEGLPDQSEKVTFGSNAGDFSRWDAGMQVGAGYNFHLKRSILALDVRYGYGFVDLSKDVSRYNRTLNVSLQLSRPGKKKENPSKG